MKNKPTTPLGRLDAAKRMSAEAGFKIFTPSGRYFRAEHQFIAAANDTRAKGVFRLWIQKEELWIEFLPFYENPLHKKFLETQLGIEIKQRKHHPAMRRFNPIHKMVPADQYEEFNLLNLHIRLS